MPKGLKYAVLLTSILCFCTALFVEAMVIFKHYDLFGRIGFAIIGIVFFGIGLVWLKMYKE